MSMHQQVEVVYENGVLRPVTPLPVGLREHQHLTVTIEGQPEVDRWSGADPTISLDDVRKALAKLPGSLAQLIHVERDER